MKFHKNFITAILCGLFIISSLKQYESTSSDESTDSQLESNKTRIIPLDPLVYLTKYGYLDARIQQNLNESKKTSRNYLDLELAVRNFQKFAKLNTTGKLDNATMSAMQLPRCGNPDIHRKSKRHVLQGSKWAKPVIKFKVRKYPKYSMLDSDVINDELKRAFGLWAQNANIEVELDESGEAKKSDFIDAGGVLVKESVDIEIRFETGFHGDSEAFDGRGLILGTLNLFYSIFSVL
jgi:matrix metalloproteinase-14 (membrane-inserted)